MTEIEQKALALLNKVRSERGGLHVDLSRDVSSQEALCRAIERHEAFRQEVSDVAQEATEIIEHWSGDRAGAKCLQDFIIPKPEPDPLVDVLLEMDLSSDLEEGQHDAKWLRIKLDALGFEIREKNDDQ